MKFKRWAPGVLIYIKGLTQNRKSENNQMENNRYREERVWFFFNYLKYAILYESVGWLVSGGVCVLTGFLECVPCIP
jgi:hypothetical protein